MKSSLEIVKAVEKTGQLLKKFNEEEREVAKNTITILIYMMDNKNSLDFILSTLEYTKGYVELLESLDSEKDNIETLKEVETEVKKLYNNKKEETERLKKEEFKGLMSREILKLKRLQAQESYSF